MENGIIIYYFVASTVVLLLVVAIISYALLHQKRVVQFRTQLHEEELQKQQAIFEALQDGQEKERERLARELHDGLGARLSGLKMNLEYLDMNATEYKELISKVFRGVGETLEEVRQISHGLLPYHLNEKGLRTLIQNCIEEFNAGGACAYDFFMDETDAEINDTIKLNIYRIVAELLHNIQKHAKATHASVQIGFDEGKVQIAIEDNGIGLKPGRQSEGIGLTNIRSRVQFCKGLMNIDTSEKGTLIIIEIPLK